MKQDYIFLGEEGLTSTSANHIANVAKEFYQTVESELEGVKLINKSVTTLTDSNVKVLSRGNDSEFIESIESKLQQIVEAKSLIAWLREAIKAKERLLEEVKSLRMSDFCKLQNIDFKHESIERPTYMSEDEYLATLSIKDRNRLLELQTQCAVIGKYIHLDGKFNKARKDLKSKLQEPNYMVGSDKDAIIYSYTPSVLTKDVDDVFFKLQAKHRAYQAELNGLLHLMQEALDKDKFEKNAEYSRKIQESNAKLESIQAQMREFQDLEIARISKMKIVIPNDLKDMFNFLNKIGK